MSYGEAELEACIQAVRHQKGVEVTHQIISDMPEYQAHNKLWEEWGKQRSQHDVFVKVDADTILSRPSALREVSELFKKRGVTGAQIMLHDYYTNDLISGLNAFSPQVEFKPAKHRLFADHADVNHTVVLRGESVAHLAPIGWHCENPHPRQAFFFGLHRALKKQSEVIRKCATVWLAKRDVARSWALTGARYGGLWHATHIDYSEQKFEKVFVKHKTHPNRIAQVEKFANEFNR